MDRVRRKEILVGAEDFIKIRTGDYYYVDKTGLIRDLLQKKGEVTLFTRPRRFGKSLNMSMLKAFFEYGCSPQLFEGLEITEETELCEKYMGRFPVISVSLKSAEEKDFVSARSQMCTIIGNEALRFQFLLQSSRLTECEKALYRQLITVDRENKEMFSIPDAVLNASLQTLSSLLHKHYGQKAIILIDEYDVPLAKASERGYYDQMLLLIRNLFGQALKTNASLEFAVLTGCLRISKESVFTGLNNLKVFSLTNRRFSQYFGFTDQEVRELLEYYGCAHCYEAVREWYDGYQFGSTNVYCPWDVLNYCDSFYGEGEEMPQNYWINTSGNDIIRTFIQMSEKSFARHEMEQLLSGETVAKEIRQDLTYRDLYDSIENMWGVLFATGYLTSRGQAGDGRLSLAIPNKEVQEIFARQLIQHFQEAATKDGAAMEAFCTAVQEGDAAEVERRFQAYLRKTVSIHDYSVRNRLKENFYHGILLGFLSFKEGWTVASNREAGEGYSDIVIVIEEESTGIIIEVKYPQSGNLEAACQEALGQIGQMRYDEFLREQGIQTILKYGIACWKKRCRVVLEKEE